MKNKLSVWTYSYRPQYYFTHPWKWFKDTYWNIRNFWHRGRYGFAYCDVWEWCTWWPQVGAAALRYMAKHGYGYPGYEPWDTIEKWHEYLNKLADELDKAADSTDYFFADEENEYSKAFYNIAKEYNEMNVEDKIIKQKYYSKADELTKQYDIWRKKLFAEIGKNLPRFWD